ncbi:hypothetical protein KC19_6G136200 [Ceratodon purpureus]|uniref:Small ribosomal subunit protein uS15c n=1 Tax=Ceratodon purpureus TaxID=3225 RepID=A0A8T0HGE7_CERPU|nr:hypothetical protein KC19_6G136200 [Ceratodon purpureus]
MASRVQSRLLRPLLQRSGVCAGVREVSTFNPLRSPENDTTARGETEDFASKILLEMRGRKGEEKQASSEESVPDSGSSYLSQLTMRGLKARTEDGAPAESPLQKLGQLSRLGDMNQGPGYMFLPPKEHLLEKYYADEHLSAMERQKMELKKVREEYRIHEGDCGSSQVQIALLTAKIKYMAEHMKTHKKDLHSRKGLEGMLEQRKKLLKYLRRTDWDEYCILITRLGLRDKPNEVR